MPDPRFTKFREDGWPLCPLCGREELWATVVLGWKDWHRNPTLAECLAGGFGCYACGAFFAAPTDGRRED